MGIQDPQECMEIQGKKGNKGRMDQIGEVHLDGVEHRGSQVLTAARDIPDLR